MARIVAIVAAIAAEPGRLRKSLQIRIFLKTAQTRSNFFPRGNRTYEYNFQA